MVVFLAEMLKRLHEKQFYHKGMRSDSVIFFRRPEESRSLVQPYLVGFDFARKAKYLMWPEKPV